MQSNSTFKLILNSKEFIIPSDFSTLGDINEDIYKILLSTQKYEVKSYVHENTFQLFIDYWVKREIPNLLYDKYLIEYIQLSEEFDIMKNLIQIFLNNTSHSNIHSLMINKNNKSQIQIKKSELLKEKEKFKQTIEILFNNEAVGFNQHVFEEKDNILYSIEEGDFEYINSITKKKVDKNGFSFILNENDKTAQLYKINKEDNSTILIPSSINHESKEYSITTFSKFFRILNNTKSIKFDENSMIKKLDVSISCIDLEEISIPENMCEFSGHWCNSTANLTKVKISPKNKNLVFYEDKFLIGKSDIKSDVFDILYFARRDIEEAIIPPFIRIISPYAFNCCNKLTKVEFSEDSKLQIIGEGAFSYSSLTSISIPKSVTTISSCAFDNCSLTDLTFSEDSQLELIDVNAFKSTSLQSVLIPSSVKIIGESAFCLCENLNEVKFSENSHLKIIGKEAFNSSGLINIEIPRSVVYIGDQCFDYCSNCKEVVFQKDSELLFIGWRAFNRSFIKKIKIPRNVLVIGKESFFGCVNLQKVEFEENSNLRNIDDYAFTNCLFKKISIPSNVIRIGDSVFSYCNNLEKVEFEKNSKLRIIEKLAFTQTQMEEIHIPSSVVCICEKSFDCCKKLKCVKFDKNSELEVIENSAFNETLIESFVVPSNVKQIQKNAFFKCQNLTNFDLSNDLKIHSIPSLFDTSSITCISLPDNLVEFGEDWCLNTPNLVEVKISPNNKNFIYYEDKYLIGKSDLKSENAFDILYFVRRDIEEAIVPSFIRIISSSAFNSCVGLKKVDFLDDSQLQKIDNSAFFDIKIEQIKIPKHVTEIGKVAFGYCDQLKEIEFSENSELRIIKDSSFCYTALTKIVIPSSVVEIQNGAFSFCIELKEVEFEKNSEIKCLGDQLFEGSSINVISFPDNLVELNERMLVETGELVEIKIPPKNKNFVFYEDKYLIGKSDIKSDTYDVLHFARRDIEEAIISPFIRIISPFAFNGCQNLTKVDFPDDSKLQIIGDYAFDNASLESICIPKSVVEIKSNIFQDTSLQKVEFEPNSLLKIIGQNAFYDSQITQIVIPSNVTKICENAFNYCRCLNCVVFEKNSKLELIDTFAFAYSEIKKISIPKSVKKIADSSFENCRSLDILDLSESSNLVSIGKKAFNGIPIKSIMIPSSVVYIDDDAFIDCENLQLIEFGEGSKLKLFNYKDLNYDVLIMVPPKINSISFKKILNLYDALAI